MDPRKRTPVFLIRRPFLLFLGAEPRFDGLGLMSSWGCQRVFPGVPSEFFSRDPNLFRKPSTAGETDPVFEKNDG